MEKSGLPSNNADSPALQDLQSQVQGEVIVPSDPHYEESALGWNRNIRQRPAVIIVPETAKDVQTAVVFAGQQGLGVAVQNTGHGNYGGLHDGLLILTRALDELEVDPVNETARIGAGVQWGPILAAAQEHGLAPLLGSSPGVGAVGYTLGGGLGWLGRKYGLSCDNVLSFDMVTAAGELLTVSETENSDLYWGLRGGGGGLGIVTGMVIRLFPVTDVYAGNLFYPAEMAQAVFGRYRDWIAGAPDELTTSVLFMNFPPMPELPEFIRGQSFAIVRGCYCGDIKDGEAQMQYWREWQSPLLDDFKTIPFREAATISNDPEDPLPAYISGAWLRQLDETAIDALIDFARGQGGPPPLMFAEVRHAGGAISRVPEESAAIGNRDAELVISLVAVAPGPEAYQRVAEYSEQLYEALRPSLTGGVYMNFLDEAEAAPRIREGLSGGAYERLSKLKARVDPDNLLRYSFAILPTG